MDTPAPEPRLPDPPKADRRASIMLVLVTVLWGLSFPLMKDWQLAAIHCPGGELVASATIIALRMFLALAVLAVFRPRLFTAPRRREHTYGAALGLTFFLGFLLQVLGLADTTPALSAFLTTLTCAWVPLLAWLGWRARVRALTLLGLGLGLVGAAVLAGLDAEGGREPGRGEVLTLLASVFFAGQILLLDRLGRTLQPMNLTVGSFLAAGCAALATAGAAAIGPGWWAWGTWVVRVLATPTVLGDVAALTLLSTVLAFTWMNTYQPRVPASRAALIYLLEPVFASLFSILLGHDELTARLLAGGGIILGGNLLVELPVLLRDARRESGGEVGEPRG